MASLLSPTSSTTTTTTLLFFFFFLLLSFSPPSLSEKTQLPTNKTPLPTKKILEVEKEKGEEQPINLKPKPKKNPLPTKKPKEVKVEDEEQSIPKPKKTPLPTKKTKQVVVEVEEDEDQPNIPKPKRTPLPTKKPKQVEEEEEEQSTPKPKLKKIPSKLTQPPPTKKKNDNPKESDNPDPIWLDEASEDMMSEFRDLPSRIHSSLLPDLRKISITSGAYFSRANRELAARVEPFVGRTLAPRVALAASSTFLLLPLLLLLLLALLSCRLHSRASLRRLLLFAHAYLALYFLTLSFSALATGLEPLRLLHATSPSAYAWTQAAQATAYVLYLLAQAVELAAVFSGWETEAGARPVALAQAAAGLAAGLAVGLHYYSVAGEAPRANWKVHAVYAGCFLTLCLLAANAERRKKAYDGGEDGKRN